MDVASIAATNDDRLKGLPTKSGSQEVRADIAKVYNHYKGLLSEEERLDKRIGPLFPPDKTPASVRNDFLTLAGKVAAATALGIFRSPPSISKD
jgi:hypothetical protein